MAMRRADQLRAILKAIDKLDNDTLGAARKIIELVGVSDPDKLRSAMFETLLPAAKVGADTAAEIGAAMYNKWRAEDTGQKIQTVAYSAYDEGKYMSAINAAVKKGEDGASTEEMLKTLSGRIGYTSRTSYSGTLFENGKRDSNKPMYARVPAEGEACQFCLMLASNGFRYSAGALGDNVHNHANCRCTYTCSWDDDPRAQGYDPDRFYDEWKDSIENEAQERAERNGTTVSDERKAIMQRYADQSARSKELAKRAGTRRVTASEANEDVLGLTEQQFARRAEDYIAGDDMRNALGDDGIEYVKKNLETIDGPIYRIERSEFTYSQLADGEKDIEGFSFDGELRSFTKSRSALNGLGADIVDFDNIGEYVVFQVESGAEAFDMGKYAKAYIDAGLRDQKEVIAAGLYELDDDAMFQTIKVNGISLPLVKLRQIKPKL